tara:strand:- start:688 stop:1107 length:420 start_codon:yes stop_codon:yes gene_type:complete
MKQNYHFSNSTRKSFRTSENFVASLRYALKGLIYCFKLTRNFRIQVYFAIFSLVLGFILNLKSYEFLILISTIISVLILELLNTSIESLVDIVVGKKYNKLAKISKDCAAASVLLAAINSIFIAVYLFFPKIIIIIEKL